MVDIKTAAKTLGIANALRWIQKLNKFSISTSDEGLSDSDYQRLLSLKNQYALLEVILEENNLDCAVVGRKIIEEYLLFVDAGKMSVDLPCTDAPKKFFVDKSKMDLVRKAYRFSGNKSDHHGILELKQKYRVGVGPIITYVLSGKIDPKYIEEVDGFYYFSDEYLEKCKYYASATTDISVVANQLSVSVDFLKSAIAGVVQYGKIDSYFFGTDYDEYCFKDMNKVRKCVHKKQLENAERKELSFIDAGEKYIQAHYFVADQNFPSLKKIDFSDSTFIHQLNTFVDGNDEFSCIRTKNGLYIKLECTDRAKLLLKFFVRYYLCSYTEMIDDLLPIVRAKFPIFTDLMEHSSKTRGQNQASVLITFYCYSEKDIVNCSNSDIAKLTVLFGKQTLLVSRLFESVVKKALTLYACKYTNFPQFRDSVRNTKSQVKEAYTKDQYATMAYCVFNEKYIQENKLWEKACNNDRYAQLWLFISLHWICAIRPGDLARIPLPAVDPNVADKNIEDIASDAFSCWIYEEIVDKLAFDLEMNPMKPHKTEKHNPPNLKIFFPQSLKAFFGKLILLVASFKARDHKPLFLSQQPIYPASLLEAFFGNLFVQALRSSSFSSISANKSYLQSIQDTADSNPAIPVEGYFLATIARSHIGNYGEFAQITDTYLSDSNFKGRSPEYYAHMMFERGVLSFIPHFMLSILSNEYESLSAEEQTLLIRSVNEYISPLDIEETMRLACRTMENSKKNVLKLLSYESKDSIREGLESIATGCSLSRTGYSYCLLRALGKECNQPSCLGCPYELQTRTDIYLIALQYKAISAKFQNEPEQRIRYKKILDKIIPVLISAMSYLKQHDPNGSLFHWLRGVLTC